MRRSGEGGLSIRRGEACLALFDRTAVVDAGRRMRRPYEEEETFARGGFETRPHDDACVAAAKEGSASVGARDASPSSTGLLLLMQGSRMSRPYEEEEPFARGGFEIRPHDDACVAAAKGGSASEGEACLALFDRTAVVDAGRRM